MSFDTSAITNVLQHTNWVDLALGAWLILALLHGFAAGFVRMLGNLVGLVLGIVVAGWYYEGLAAWGVGYLPAWAQAFGPWLKVLAFVFIFIAFAKVTGLIFEALNTMFGLAAMIPFLSTINRFLGAVFSAAEAVITIATILFVLSRHPVLGFVRDASSNSVLAARIQTVVPFVEPLYPALLTKLPSLIGS